jgi:L-aspartate oxidase
VVTKKERAASSTNYARGGIAAVMAPEDSFELHIRDTLLAGAGLCHADAVAKLVREGPLRVRELMEWGAAFSRDGGALSLGREGGHSRRRIVHAADLTGRVIERALLEALAALANVELFEDHQAVDLLVGRDPGTGGPRCAGAKILTRHGGEEQHFIARFTLLATGGLGRAYLHTTNPDIATGDGMAMAHRAGARVVNLEFVQFHPTALYPTEDRAILISEAVRGEGAVLLRLDGQPLLEGVHQGSLATRDVVAREIDLVLKERGEPHVLLDLSPIPAPTVERRFPGILEECRLRGLDIRQDPIPVVPAAHYACGGVATDAWGRTSLPGLYAAGEVACTGVHGANRLASNSLLEALVFSHRAAEQVPLELRHLPAAEPSPPLRPAPAGGRGGRSMDALEAELRTLMWESAGIVRTNERLERAERALQALREEAEAELAARRTEARAAEMRNLVETALLVVRCARLRRESRGLHFNTDHPHRNNERFLRDTVVPSGV